VVRHAGALPLSRPISHAGLDEDDVRVRPGRGSRPRTRRRPAHEDAAEAFVAAVDRGRYTCVPADPAAAERDITAMKARELGRRSVVVGDTVSLAGDVSGAPGTLARIVRVAPRRSVLRRSADYDAGLDPLLCLTKSDLARPDGILALYAPLGVRYLVTGRPLAETVLDELRALLADRISVLVGHSGVGKSTLVNALIPEAGRAVGTVSPVTGRGRHTSSSVVALRLRGGGWIIDTPGLRSFGLGHIAPDRVVAAFPDLAEGVSGCPPVCSHLEPDCALDEWVAEHDDASGALAARLDSLRRLLRSREGDDDT
jgi:ribosome biogenesis GTPase / thiamine phosphate phosphatase